MELIKNIAAVVGCVSAVIGLLVTIFKPIRESILDSIVKKSKSQQQDQDIKIIKQKLSVLDEVILRLDRVEKNVLENEADRIRAELFDCGNRCRRGIRLHPEEMDHIRSIFDKYKNVLHKNHEGETEYDFICSYYNQQDFPIYHQKND